MTQLELKAQKKRRIKAILFTAFIHIVVIGSMYIQSDKEFDSMLPDWLQWEQVEENAQTISESKGA